MKNKYLIYAVIPALGIGLLGASSVYAHGMFWGAGNLSPDDLATRQQAMFQQQADLLGITLDQYREKWADGKTLKEIAAELSITKEQLAERLKKTQQDRLSAQLKILVDKGVITQTQADRRLQAMEQQSSNGKKFAWGRRIHRGFWFR